MMPNVGLSDAWQITYTPLEQLDKEDEVYLSIIHLAKLTLRVFLFGAVSGQCTSVGSRHGFFM